MRFTIAAIAALLIPLKLAIEQPGNFLSFKAQSPSSIDLPHHESKENRFNAFIKPKARPKKVSRKRWVHIEKVHLIDLTAFQVRP